MPVGETHHIVQEVLKFINKDMNGLDLGSGGLPVIPQAISVDYLNGIYTDNVQLRGNVANLYWFKDDIMDYVFSSHCLEDFEHPNKIIALREWIRVVKPGGLILLYLPDEQRFRAYCGGIGNPNHKDEFFSIKTMREIIEHPVIRGTVEEIYAIEEHQAYSFFIVLRKL